MRGQEKKDWLQTAVEILKGLSAGNAKFVSWDSLGKEIARRDSVEEGAAPKEYRANDEKKRCCALRSDILAAYHNATKNYAANLGFNKRRKIPGEKANTLWQGGNRISEGIWLVPDTDALESMIANRGKRLNSQVENANKAIISGRVTGILPLAKPLLLVSPIAEQTDEDEAAV